MSVQYFYFVDRDGLGGFNFLSSPQSKDPTILPLTDRSNPVYNFSPTFLSELQKVTALDVAQSQPYISLCSLDSSGNVLVDFNKEFFMKPIDMQGLPNANRYGDRPVLSLKSVKLSTDLAAGAGLTSWTKASLSLVIHKPNVIGTSALKNLLFTGTALRLIYGWNSKNDFLNEKHLLLINVNAYDIGFNAQGEAEITLEGLTHIANMANVFVGDEAQEVPNADGIYERAKETKEFVTYTTVLRFRPTAQGQRDVKVMEALASKYKQVIDRASEKVQKNFNDAMDLLRSKRQSNSTWFPDVQRKSETGGIVGSQYVTVHDIIGVLCGKTLTSLSTTLFNDKDFRVVYGTFNETAGIFKDKSIADFPIHWNSFEQNLKDLGEGGQVVPTLQAIFNILCNQFIGNQFYWDNFKDDQSEEILYPKITFDVTSTFIERRETIQFAIADTRRNVPVTLKKLSDSFAPFLSEADQERAVVGSQKLPVIKFGHANSFVKNVHLTHQDDENVKALLINRAGMSNVTSARQPFATLNTAPDFASQALQLPLRGDMELLGHGSWLPGRFFYLSSGIYFLDGAYSIISVEHNIDSSQFTTRVNILMN